MSNNIQYNPKKLSTPSSNGIKTFPTSSGLQGYVRIEEYKKPEVQNNTNNLISENILDFDSILIENNSQIRKETSKGYSTNNYSDIDNIYINKLSDVMTDIQNKLGPEYYEIYSAYITGLKLSDFIDEEGNIIPLTDKSRLSEIINEKNLPISSEILLSELNNYLMEAKINFGPLSSSMLSSTVTEVVKSDYGFDAMVLKNTEGNYLIVNSCTNAESTDDIYAIAYVLAKQIVGEGDLLDLVVEQIIPALNNTDIKNSEYYLDLVNKGGTEYLEKVYDAQLNANIELIKKYATIAKEEGNKIQLNGYSLGGGLQLTAYSLACINDPSIEDYIESVSVFNPFISYLEQNNANTGTEKKGLWQTLISQFQGDSITPNTLVSYVASSEKVRIYSGEEDYISTFNNSVYNLLSRFTFVKTEDLDRGKLTSLSELYGFVLGDDANHGFKPIEESSFDEYGNIKETGKYISINDSLKSIIDPNNPVLDIIRIVGEFFKTPTEEELYQVDYSSIILQTLKLTNIDDLKKAIPEIEPIITEITRYIRKNVGNYTYEGIANAITEGVWDIVGDTIDKEVPNIVSEYLEEYLPGFISEDDKKIIIDYVSSFATDIVNKYKDKEAFTQAFNDFLTSEENKEYVLDLIKNLNSGEYLKACKKIQSLIYNFKDSFEVNYEDIGIETINIFGQDIEYTNEISKIINNMIKDTIISTVEGIIGNYIKDAIADTFR